VDDLRCSPNSTAHAPTGPDHVFPDADVTTIVDTLLRIRQTAAPPREVA